MKHVQANMPNRDSPAQPMKDRQPLMKGEQLLVKGNWICSLSLLYLEGQVWSGHPLGEQVPCPPNSSNMWPYQCTWLGSCILVQLGGEHGGPCIWIGLWSLANSGECLLSPGVGYPCAGIMLFLQFLAGWWSSTDGIFLFWLHLLGQSGWLTCHLGNDQGLWLSFAISCQKWPSSMGPMGPAMAAFPWGGLCSILDRCDP